MWLARAKEKVGEPIDEEMAVLYSELLYASTRVRVKLASTIPPPGRGGGEEGRRGGGDKGRRGGGEEVHTA